MWARVMIVCVIRFLILKKQYHPSNLKTLTKFSSLVMWIMLPKIFYLLVFAKVVSLRTLADANCFQDELSMYFVGNKSLALELRTVSQFILKRSGYDITVYSNYTVSKYSS